MISAKYRVHKSKFPNVLKGFSLFGTYFRAVVSSETGLKNPKIAVIISKKQASRAVDRNFYRRMVFEVIQPIISMLSPQNIVFLSTQKLPHYNQNKDIIMTIKKDAVDLTQKIIKKYEKSS